MNPLIKLLPFVLVAAVVVAAQDDNWPSLSYLKNDYKAVSVVAHVRIQQAEITGHVGGYENWKVTATVLESLKGGLKKDAVIEYYHGAEAGLKRNYFDGEKIVFLLAKHDRDRKVHYSVLENSTLPSTPDRLRKLRSIKNQLTKKRHSVSSTSR